ncbi:MAG TPA: pyrroline-5-carboxylate reductase [Leptolyngbyaceae cyanobacterium M33_DOE_097]|uniref:Pyrroline-5-carboxylate reductase n=1 Tax=Oscillatoriales cyanobacterium SpSt-418 TaxID=2282169 RepID=A0A7C3PG59_9CYAN|nr:pyrroline-5-carboxylate reductase [Leptolyngbyaceae cyanobacterium M33_DOE_097]
MATQFGMIGGGVMGEAILARLIQQGMFAPVDVIVSEPMPERRALLAEQYGVTVTAENRMAIAAETVMLAVKPQAFAAVVTGLQQEPMINESHRPLILSILAGIPLSKLEAAFAGCPVVRAMPNTPATIGAGMTAIAPGQRAEPQHLALAERIFQVVGEVVQVPESLMDAVTGLSGSGPGYIALVIEALSDGGVAAGLPRATATKLAIQTVKGTAQLLQETGLHPGELKDRVTSPGGTTIAGIARLEEAGLRSALIEAVKTASARSQELGR